MKDRKISFKIESQRFDELQTVADKEGVTVSSILRSLTRKYLDFCKAHGFFNG
jgi:predicted DNA-binding ribbon-helix-helix protein